jgi:two-component system sensor histidine kinase KdpD
MKWWHMAVEDMGQGIPAALRKRVFDKSFRAMRDGDVPTREPSGTGMGLAIAKGIVEAHGGRIWIEPGRDGKGTRVFLSCPSSTMKSLNLYERGHANPGSG